MLLFTAKLMDQLREMFYVAEDHTDGGEFQAYGRIAYLTDDGDVVCDELSLPKQESGQASIHSEPGSLMDWQEEQFKLRPGMSREEIETLNVEMQRWRIWLHTHPGTSRPGYSSTDYDTLRDRAKAVQSSFIGVVMSKALQNTVYLAHHGLVPFLVPFPDGDQLDVLRPTSLTKKERQRLGDMFKSRVTKKVYTSSKPSQPAILPGMRGGWKNGVWQNGTSHHLGKPFNVEILKDLECVCGENMMKCKRTRFRDESETVSFGTSDYILCAGCERTTAECFCHISAWVGQSWAEVSDA